MSDSIAGLRRKISGAADLQSVVRTMKAVAASSIGQYEKSVLALSGYNETIERGLAACFRKGEFATMNPIGQADSATAKIGVIVFGSDQGLVGQFNEVVAEFAMKTLAALPGKPQVWAVGERVHACLTGVGLPPIGLFAVPTSVQAITRLVGLIQIESEAHRVQEEYARVYVFHNRPQSGSLYGPVSQRLLPLDIEWQRRLSKIPWPTKNLVEVFGSATETIRVLIREYLFISLFRACAESLASENESRLAAMGRADKNIDELLDALRGTFHRLRQGRIDEELFDVVAGYESLAPP